MMSCLWLLRCGINGSFDQCHKLKELEYLSSQEQQNPIGPLNLPPTLKHLQLYSCDHIDGISELKEQTKFLSLELIYVPYDEPELPSSVKDIFQLMMCCEATCITLDGERGEYIYANEKFLELS